LAVAFSGYHGQDLVHLSGRESAHRTKINPVVFVFMGDRIWISTFLCSPTNNPNRLLVPSTAGAVELELLLESHTRFCAREIQGLHSCA